MFIKTFDAEDNLTGAERIDVPVYVRWQTCNDLLVRCSEGEEAQGILSADENAVYLINGQMPHGKKEPYAVAITEAEYDSIIGSQPPEEDVEDTEPEIPEGAEGETILTRAELTARVTALEDELQAAKILLGVE